MPIQTICTLTDRQRLAPDTYSFRLKAEELARTAKPGQFVNIACGDGHLLRRPISICDAADGQLRIVFQVRGEGTAWLAEQKPGAQLDLLGPLGHGYTYPDRGRVLVVGGGIGVPPMLYAAKAAPEGADACLGCHTRELSILSEEFSAVCGRVTLSSDDGTLGYHGFVDELVRRALEEERYGAVFACGPKPMLRSVYEAAKAAGTPCQVSMEERMGCGIGACLVCACKVGGHYRHVCKDGPVFRAEEVNWDE